MSIKIVVHLKTLYNAKLTVLCSSVVGLRLVWNDVVVWWLESKRVQVQTYLWSSLEAYVRVDLLSHNGVRSNHYIASLQMMDRQRDRGGHQTASQSFISFILIHYNNYDISIVKFTVPESSIWSISWVNKRANLLFKKINSTPLQIYPCEQHSSHHTAWKYL